MYTTNGRTITLKRGIAEYFNEDCPDIYNEAGYRVFHSDINGIYFDSSIQKQLYKFIKRSYELACKKYNWEMHNDLRVLIDLEPKK
jgi:hypothetical protein